MIQVPYYERRNGSDIEIVNCSLSINDTDCRSGLIHNYQTMKMISAFGPIITGEFNIFLNILIKINFMVIVLKSAGVFAASLSSALGDDFRIFSLFPFIRLDLFVASLVGAPKILQAVCRDMIFPRLKYFAVGHGKSDEPHRAYFLIYFIAVSFTAIGKDNFD